MAASTGTTNSIFVVLVAIEVLDLSIAVLVCGFQ
jgi:hypothetical protein